MNRRPDIFVAILSLVAAILVGACGSSREVRIDAGTLGDSASPSGATGDGGGGGADASAGGAGADGGPGSASAGADGAAAPDGAGGSLGPPDQHRAVAVACKTTSSQPPDGGVGSCAVDSDCGGDAGYNPWHCLRHACGVDQCIDDSDCRSDQACGCGAQFGFPASMHLNYCVPAKCRVDADCGAGGYCSPATNTPCQRLAGYYCHKAADTCSSSNDCPAADDGGATFSTTCDYVLELDHWACAATALCGG
jgi:hypothetical protein